MSSHRTQGLPPSEEVETNDELPTSFTVLIDNQEALETIFTEFPAEVDFQTENVYLYVFTCAYMGRSCEIQSIKENESELTVTVALIRKGKGMIGDMSFPQQRCVAVKMKNTIQKNVKFSIIEEKADFWDWVVSIFS